MNTYALEKRIETLEKELDNLAGRFSAYLRFDAPRVGDLEIEVQTLKARLKDFDKLEQIILDAYLNSHPKAQDDMTTFDRMVDFVSHEFYFNNLPTIKDARSRRS